MVRDGVVLNIAEHEEITASTIVNKDRGGHIYGCI